MSIFKQLLESMGLEEKRKSGPEHYPTLDSVVKEFGDRPDADDIYIHYSNDFTDSKNQLINQVGINVKQDYTNPFGIYAYPIKQQYGDFKKDAEYAYILKTKKLPNWLDDISKMPQGEFKRCMDILAKKYFPNESEAIHFQKDTEQKSDNKTLGGVLFYMIVLMSTDKKINKSSKPNVFQTSVWTKDLGYSGFNDPGEAIIHPSEPYQAVWFSSKGFDVLDVAKNRSAKYNAIDQAVGKGKLADVKQAYEMNKLISPRSLRMALHRGNTDVVKYLLDVIKKAGKYDYEHYVLDSIPQAIELGDNDIIKSMLDTTDLISMEDVLGAKGITPEQVKNVLSLGKVRGGGVDTLLKAIGTKNPEIVRLAIANGSNNSFGDKRVLNYAIEYGDAEMVQDIINGVKGYISSDSVDFAKESPKKGVYELVKKAYDKQEADN